MDKFRISVAVAVFVREEGDKIAPHRCAFYDRDGKIYLPNEPVTVERHANQVAMNIIKWVVPVDPRLLSITPIGFFDPILKNTELRADREVVLGYRVIISPGMPVLKDLEFKDHEELKLAFDRVNPAHFRVFRVGLFY